MQNEKENIAIIIPCYNEEASIGSVLTELEKHITTDEFKIIVVNDASSDNTSKSVKQNKNTYLLNLPIRLGVGAAFQTGILKALELNCKYAIKLDGDGQHPPEHILNLLRQLKESETDIAIGSRFIDPNYKYPIGIFRYFGILLLRLIAKILTGNSVSDPTSGYRAYNLKAMTFMAKYCPNFDYYETEEIILASKNNLKIREFPVTMRNRLNGSSSISSFGSVFYMVRVMLSMIIIFLRKPEK